MDSNEVTRQVMDKEESASACDLPEEKEDWGCSFIHLSSEDITASKSFGTATEQVEKYQETYKSLEFDCKSLETSRRASEQDESRLQGEIQLLRRRLEQHDMNTQAEKKTSQQMLDLEREKTRKLLAEKQALEIELRELERLQIDQEKYCKVPDTFPDRDMVFKGHVEELMRERVSDMLTVLPQVRYPMPAGSALITFENPEVAKKIAAMKQHKVKLDEGFFVHVKAELIELMLPSSLEISLERIPQQVVLSGVETSSSVSEEHLHDKLELFFSKRKNGGGEVDRIEQLNSPGQLLLTFAEDEVAKHLIQIGQFQVPIGNETHTVKLSYYTTGKLTDLQFSPSVCSRTVLLSGIPDVLEEDLMREALEIHFQKPSKGGGEVEAVTYVPANHQGCAVAVFEGQED
ncbi:interferon-induced 35 kDa protein isoform X2 [Tiliqua scincoides]